ncbi:hypothetical protein INT45_001102 [Circinella minor]|uniref:Uncharacterized protein n=1 Tax=Circinella minor TaxID=1195481 RepID=A0A8H7RH62_9FUNG|nr:hypothetical protein INT45_001102 [Circinella minor]
MKSTCNYIKEKLLTRNLPLIMMWSQIPDDIRDRAIERFEQHSYTSLGINLGRCKENWIAEYVLHQGWSNRAGLLKRKQKNLQQEPELTPSASPDEGPEDNSSTTSTNEDIQQVLTIIDQGMIKLTIMNKTRYMNQMKVISFRNQYHDMIQQMFVDVDEDLDVAVAMGKDCNVNKDHNVDEVVVELTYLTAQYHLFGDV